MISRRFLLTFVFLNLFEGLNGGFAFAQLEGYDNNGLELKLVRTAGLREVDIAQQDSASPVYKSCKQFSLHADSIWEHHQYCNDFDSGITNYSFDSANRVLFESRVSQDFISQGWIAYYNSYDSLGRIIKESTLRPIDNRLITDCYFYNKFGDSVILIRYDENGNISDSELLVYDSNRQLLFKKSKWAYGAQQVYQNKYDRKGRLIEEEPAKSQSPTARYYNGLARKIMFVDSLGIENRWKYKWDDISWSKHPQEHRRLDSTNLREITETFDTAGVLVASEVTDYKLLGYPVHTRYENTHIHFVRIDDFTYGPHNELTSYIMRHGDHIFTSETYNYIYSK